MTPHMVHAITPGDHFSPRTGSAIPTVVHGLAGAAASADPSSRHLVLVDSSTFHPRYTTADVVEYSGARSASPAFRAADAALAKLGLPRWAAGRAWQPQADALARQPASIVLAHNAPVLPALLRGQRHATVLYAHNDLFRTIGRREAARALGDIAAIVCVSADLATHTASRLPRSLAQRVHVVDNGIDVTTFTPPETRRAAGPLRVMYLGRIVADKGPDVLLQAAAALPADSFEFVLVGSAGFDAQAPLSPYELSLRRLADTARASVTFQPFVDRSKLPALLQSADVLVVPSRWREPSGLTVGEAMATGLPVIASNVGGIPEVLGDAGILVPSDDPAALADRLRRLASDPDERAELGCAARSRAESRSWHASWAQLQAVVGSL